MNICRALALVFLLMGGYGCGVGKTLPTVMAFGMAGLMLYADRKFTKQDVEFEKYDRIRRSLILTTETMLDLHECESHALVVYNPSAGLQVAD